MGEFIVEGECRRSGLDSLVIMPLADMPVKTCRYGCLLNERGGIIDDLVVFRMEKEKWFIVVNGATIQKDAGHFRKHLAAQAVFRDVSAQTGKIDVQGPRSREILKILVANIGNLDYYSFDFFDLLGQNVLISRTGYTGELGYEIYFPWARTADLWQELMKLDGVRPAGLGARDTLRLEVGYSLYGHELSEEISPLEAGLGRFIDFNKEFIGKDALVNQKRDGLRRAITGLRSASRRAPREGQKIYLPSGEQVGLVTSGTYSPSLNQGIGLGYIDARHVAAGTAVEFGDEHVRQAAVLAPRNFFKGGSLKA
jgi:aminomethyltransferase